MGTDAARVESREGGYSWTHDKLHEVLRELDNKINAANAYVTITRTSNLISKVEWFTSAARTLKMAEMQLTRTDGRITGITHITYNEDTSEDSRVTTTITRTDGVIVSSDSDFSTPEDPEI